MSTPNLPERLRQTRRLLKAEGASGIAARLRIRAAERMAPVAMQRLPIDRRDLERAAKIAAAGWKLPAPLPARSDEPLTVAWVCVPPRGGSGGHTNMFRIAAELEQAGHTCVIYLHDQHGWELEQHRRTIRGWWPWLNAEVRDLSAGMDDSHIVLATAWETAYPVLACPARGIRCYFVQDYEPAFHPAGSISLLAESTYRFGFHGVTLGSWLAQRLRREYGMSADHFDFGCDLERYGLDPAVDAAGGRSGVCYYCRPSTPRRAHELSIVALELFAARHPEVDIHLFGEPAGPLPFAATQHGLLRPEDLSGLYNRCIAGLTLSATNVSLAPHEMLAAGCIPVVNDAEHNRIALDNPHVAYAPAAPFELAEALGALVRRPAAERTAAAAAAAASVTTTTWKDAGAQVERILLDLVRSRSPAELAA